MKTSLKNLDRLQNQSCKEALEVANTALEVKNKRILELEKQLKEYKSRLLEVLENTGQLTKLDLDYCYELTLRK